MLVYQSVYSLTFCLNQYFQAGAGFVSINSQKTINKKSTSQSTWASRCWDMGPGWWWFGYGTYNLKSQQNKQNESDLFNNFRGGHGKHSHPTCRLVPIKVCTSLVRSTSRGFALLTVSGMIFQVGWVVSPRPPRNIFARKSTQESQG